MEMHGRGEEQEEQGTTGGSQLMDLPIPPLPPLDSENKYVVPALLRIVTSADSVVANRWLSVLATIGPALRALESEIVLARAFVKKCCLVARSNNTQIADDGRGMSTPGSRRGHTRTPSVVDQLQMRLVNAIYKNELFSVTNIVGARVLDVNSALGEFTGAPGWPALLHASASNSGKIVEYLTSVNGIDPVYQCNESGFTALFLAVCQWVMVHFCSARILVDPSLCVCLCSHG